MDICFFGVGGVGGYFGALFAAALHEEHNIYFIARGAHKTAICRNGLLLKKSGGDQVITAYPTLCTDSVDELPVCDLIILSVKSYDLDGAVAAIKKIVNSTTVVIPLLNGVDIYQRIRSKMTKGVVLPSCVYVGTHIESPGVIYQKGGSCKIVMGGDPQNSCGAIDTIIDLFKKAEVDISWEECVDIAIWTKFMFIAAYGLVAAANDKTLGQLLEDRVLSKDVRGILQEVATVAKELHIPLQPDVVNSSFNKAKQFPFEAKTSFQRDVEQKGEVNEHDLFGGAILRFGGALNVSTPVTKKVYNQLMLKFNWGCNAL